MALLKGQKQKDWITGKKLPGRWVEGRSYLRFRKPTLGIWSNGQIGPFAPGCQVFLDVFDEDGRHLPENAYQSLTMAGFDPHTTDQIEPFMNGEKVYWWFSDRAIKEHIRHTLTLNP